MSPKKLFTDKLTLYFSLSDSFRCFDFDGAEFCDIANTYFVAGGLVTKDEKTISLRQLKTKLNISDDSTTIKPELLLNGDFADCMSSDRLANFLQLMLDCDWMVHYTNINAFYQSLTPIADIIDVADNEVVRRMKKEMTSTLYGVLKNDMQSTLRLFAKYGFPNMPAECNKDFAAGLAKIIHKPFTDEREAMMMYTFMFLLQEAKTKKKLSSLQTNSIKALPNMVEEVFSNKLTLLGTPVVVGFPFMTEDSKQETTHCPGNLCNCSFENKDHSIEKYCSDILVEVMQHFLVFVSRPLGEVEESIQGFDDRQMHCFKLLCQVIKDSADYNSYFMNMLLPYREFSNFCNIYTKYGDTNTINFGCIW